MANFNEYINLIDFHKGKGLVPTIVQDYNTKEVLMLAYMTKESLIKTLEDKTSWFLVEVEMNFGIRGQPQEIFKL